MRFRYAFQKIVDLKINEKTQAEWLLSEAIGKVREEESSLSELHAEKNGIQEQLHRASANKATISQMMMYQQYADHIDNRITLKNKDLEKAQQVVLVKQDNLAGRMMEEKVWTKAKEKAQLRFKANMLKTEQDQLDEMATNRYRRLS
ncbi:flagellar export protein FliJ [Paenibacillus sp. NPDC056579]|uniref:flagellar export protein FliJ n=1 Tax=unclassified Paenibacillus TaxID=185978 RepID=UPI001EF833FF|nr:flagellar export protein FliJ [Paenibacillus sp. H1-7]ULL17337.1 flagellar export protein FliJ [Paenibacillus sp. H1-7]